MNRETVITHLQIVHTWAKFARERDLQFFTAKHLEDIARWADDALNLLKEQEKPNGKCVNECECWDSAYERGKQDALKEQEAIKGTIEETRGEWPDETLPVSRNKEREYPCDHSRRNKA